MSITKHQLSTCVSIEHLVLIVFKRYFVTILAFPQKYSNYRICTNVQIRML